MSNFKNDRIEFISPAKILSRMSHCSESHKNLSNNYYNKENHCRESIRFIVLEVKRRNVDRYNAHEKRWVRMFECSMT